MDLEKCYNRLGFELGQIIKLLHFCVHYILSNIILNSMPILQVISTSPLDSLTIQKAGADRIQLVSALQIGGLTPSSAVIRKSLQCVDIPTMVMVRHHNNGFVHTDGEIELFCEEVRDCLKMGVKGLVIGGITQDRQIDTNLIDKVLGQINTNKVDVTFHKAFDQAQNIVQSYEQLSKSGINRVLTQGGQQPILQNVNTLRDIVQKSKTTHKLKVLLGGGINFQNINEILSQTQTQEIHIGTCVRKDKYGPVQLSKVEQFIKLIK